MNKILHFLWEIHLMDQVIEEIFFILIQYGSSTPRSVSWRLPVHGLKKEEAEGVQYKKTKQWKLLQTASEKQLYHWVLKSNIWSFTTEIKPNVYKPEKCLKLNWNALRTQN